MKYVFKNSIRKLLKSPTPYICLAIVIFVGIFAYILVPYITYLGIDFTKYYNTNSWVVFTMQCTFVIFPFVSAWIGEKNAINNEKIYYLSKPITRNGFLIGKCLSSFLVSLIVCLFNMLILGIVALYIYIKSKNSTDVTREIRNIFDHEWGSNAYSIFGSFIGIILFASTFATLFKYQTRGGVSLIVILSIFVIYIILYPLLNDMSHGDLSKKEVLWWVTLPIIFSVPLALGLGYLGWYIFLRSEIES